MTKKPEISIVIPTCNPGKLLLRSVRSVLAQTFRDYEIIIADDGSKDSSGELIKTLQLENLYYYRFEHKNANVARNYGILHSRGKYIAMLDADDEWFRNHLEVNMELMMATECDGIYSSIEMRTPHKNSVFKARQLNKGEKMINYLLSKGIGASSSTLFMKREAAGDILWDESFKRHQDYDFVVRFSQKYKWIANEEVTAACYLNYDPKKQIDFDSCIRFIEKNKDDIAPEIFNLYHSRMYNLAVSSGADKKIVTYYQKNSGRYSRDVFEDNTKVKNNNS
ncbi:MAG: glycosyltransferase family 2 protein [Bacteroidales bacterium]|nr:glycosyltransferase family 2 protein [Bacteroidales bacterium]